MYLSMYNDEECLVATKKLSKHVHNKKTFSLDSPNIGIGVPIPKNLNKKNYRQSYFKDYIFDSVQGKSVGFSGSKFINITFRNCNFEKGNLHSCDFEKVIFCGDSSEQYKMTNIGFHKSVFTDCMFCNLIISSCGFTDAVFYNTIFKDCKIELCSLENAQFKNCFFVNCNLSILNLEYTEFDNIYATETVFPFVTIPSAYGLLQQLPLLENSNTIYSAENSNHKISISKYLELIKDFEYYYYKQRKYYALANIYIYQNRIEEGYEAIKAGVLSTIKIKDFRILRHFCRLVYVSDIFTIHQRRTLFEKITEWVAQENLSLSEYHNYQLFVGPIRETLLNNDSHKMTLYFYLETNIESSDPQKQVLLLTTIDQILIYCNISPTSIEIRHNSAYVDFLTVVCDSFAQLTQVLIMIYGSLTGITLFATGVKNVVEAAQNIMSNHDQHKIRKLEQEKMMLEINALRKEQEYKQRMEEIQYQKSIAELEKLNLELEDIEKESGKYHQILLENGIIISIRHNTKNLQSAPLREMMQYNQRQ